MSEHTYQTHPFLRNKYYNHYIRLMLSRQALNRKHIPNVSNTHRHHMLPESLGGPDTKANKVVLTWDEHFIAHALLVRITEGQDWHKMVFAFNLMCHSSSTNNETQEKFRHYRNSRIYVSNMERLCGLRSEIHKGRKFTQEHKDAMSRGMKGKKHTPWTQEQKDARSKQTRGKPKPPFSETHRHNIGSVRRGKKLGPLSEEHRRAISLGNMGKPKKPWTREQKDASSKSHTGKPLSKAHREAVSRGKTGKTWTAAEHTARVSAINRRRQQTHELIVLLASIRLRFIRTGARC